MSKIQWTEKTWNPIVGCSIVSPGCTNCYAMKQAHRLLDRQGSHYLGTTKKVNGSAVWTGKVAMAPDHILTEPLRRKKPTMYFVNSMGDLFHESAPDEWIDRIFAVMALAPQHTFQLLTKRPERMAEYSKRFGRHRERCPISLASADLDPNGLFHWDLGNGGWHLPNVWLGTSAENQATADERIPYLLSTPAAIRFLSAEPLLGPLDISSWLPGSYECSSLCGWRGRFPKDERCVNCGQVGGNLGERCDECGEGEFEDLCPECGSYCVIDHPDTHHLGWVIAGGESGPNARPTMIRNIREVISQCLDSKTPAFVKQLGSKPVKVKYPSVRQTPIEKPITMRDRKGGNMDEWPSDMRVREMPTTPVPHSSDV